MTKAHIIKIDCPSTIISFYLFMQNLLKAKSGSWSDHGSSSKIKLGTKGDNSVINSLGRSIERLPGDAQRRFDDDL